MTYTLYNGDCLDEMKNIPDGSVDLILTDPPYGTTTVKWDSVIPFEPMWEQIYRVLKPNKAVVLFSSQPFTTKLINSNFDDFKYCWVWEKTKAGNFNQAPNAPLKKHEDICVFSNGVIGHKSQTTKRIPYNPQGVQSTDKFVQRNFRADPHGYQRENGIVKGYTQTVTGYPSSVLHYGSVHNPPHPTQKPVELIEFLIKTYTDEDEVVLDFTMGSGTTGVAAKNTSRSFIGIELDKTYFDLATSRIQTEQTDHNKVDNLFDF